MSETLMLLKSNGMSLPVLQRCCCFSIETGCVLLCTFSTLLCVANITAGSWKLPDNGVREPEDNVISMYMVMFSSFSVISNIIALVGMARKRPGHLQLSVLMNSVFIVCIFLVAIVTCLFSPEQRPFLDKSAGNIVLVVVMFISGFAYTLFYLTVVNSVYKKMRMAYGDSAIPV